jgi:hypothetical protein
MDLIKKYKVVLAVVLPILLLVLLRSFSTTHFKPDAKKWSEPSFNKSNYISLNDIGRLSGEILIINLGTEVGDLNNLSKNVYNISASSILEKNNIRIIKNHNGPILLFSQESSVSSRIWMVLSQLGYKNIFILTKESDNEVLKYKFRPDSITRPEL